MSDSDAAALARAGVNLEIGKRLGSVRSPGYALWACDFADLDMNRIGEFIAQAIRNAEAAKDAEIARLCALVEEARGVLDTCQEILFQADSALRLRHNWCDLSVTELDEASKADGFVGTDAAICARATGCYTMASKLLAKLSPAAPASEEA